MTNCLPARGAGTFIRVAGLATLPAVVGPAVVGPAAAGLAAAGLATVVSIAVRLAVAVLAIAGLATVPAVALDPASMTAPGPEGTYRYRIHHSVQGSIGTRDITVRRDGADMVLTSTMRIAVKLGLITIFRREDDLVEHWRDGRLRRFVLEKRAQGKPPHRVVGDAGADGFVVTGPDGTVTGPAGIMPAHSFHLGALAVGTWVDAEAADFVTVSVAAPVAETVTIGDRTIPAQRFEVTGDITRTQWYDTNGRWLRTRLENNGTVTVERVFD